MKIIKTEVEGVVILEPELIGDKRGWFAESFRQDWFEVNVCDTRFIQDNEAYSRYGVLRGLHYQMPPYAQSKLVRAVSGNIIDVAVDIRRGSPTFGGHVAVELNEVNRRQLFVPRGFAHGYVVLSETAVVQYKCDNYYAPEYEAFVMPFDSDLGIDWGIPVKDIVLSTKDMKNPPLTEAKLFKYGDKLY